MKIYIDKDYLKNFYDFPTPTREEFGECFGLYERNYHDYFNGDTRYMKCNTSLWELLISPIKVMGMLFTYFLIYFLALIMFPYKVLRAVQIERDGKSNG